MAKVVVTETVTEKTARHKRLSEEYERLMNEGDWVAASTVQLQARELYVEIEGLRQIFFLLATGQFRPELVPPV